MKSNAEKKEQWRKIGPILEKNYPSKTQLSHNNPLELTIATILSAQCTDKRVNLVTKELFKKYKKAEDYMNVSSQELEKDIKSTGFYKAKTKNIQAMAKRLIETYHGKIPDKMEELITLGGVGRKTANIVLFHAFGKNEGIAVDTHVFRLSKRIGLSDKNTPEKIEKELMEIIPKKQWGTFTNLLIGHGRKVCTARKPLCTACPISTYCQKIGVEKKETSEKKAKNNNANQKTN